VPPFHPRSAHKPARTSLFRRWAAAYTDYTTRLAPGPRGTELICDTSCRLSGGVRRRSL